MAAPLVLCYHAVSPDWPADLSVNPADLRSQLEHLVRRGYRGVTFEQVARGNQASKPLAVTFDDGYRSVYDRAFPILEDLGLPGTVFVPAAHVGQSDPMSWPGIEQWGGTPYEGELDCMSWDQLRELADHGWEIGSHTLSHPRLPELDDVTLQRELTESREICADQMGKPCRTLAYPYGANDERVRAATRDAGYEAAAAAVFRPGEPSRFSWPRVGIYPLDGAVRFRFTVSPAVRWVRSTGVGGTLERGRTILRRHPS